MPALLLDRIFLMSSLYRFPDAETVHQNVPLQSVTVLARAGKKFPLMQEFGDFLHKKKEYSSCNSMKKLHFCANFVRSPDPNSYIDTTAT
jgi:hypothetical protein